MGYSATWSGSLEIRKENQAKCLEAINNMFRPEVMDKHAGGSIYSRDGVTKHYSWVESPGPEGFGSLPEALQALRIFDEVWEEQDTDESYYVQGDHYSKLGEEAFFLQTMAPYLEDTCLECRGEDGALWCWEIEAGQFSEKSGVVTYV